MEKRNRLKKAFPQEPDKKRHFETRIISLKKKGKLLQFNSFLKEIYSVSSDHV